MSSVPHNHFTTWPKHYADWSCPMAWLCLVMRAVPALVLRTRHTQETQHARGYRDTPKNWTFSKKSIFSSRSSIFRFQFIRGDFQLQCVAHQDNQYATGLSDSANFRPFVTMMVNLITIVILVCVRHLAHCWGGEFKTGVRGGDSCMLAYPH